MLEELYITPSALADDEWRILGAALKWADANADVLKQTRMIGGRPDAGDAYGYLHWSKDKGIACLRNPSPRPVTFDLTTEERPRDFPVHAGWAAMKIYPERRDLEEL